VRILGKITQEDIDRFLAHIEADKRRVPPPGSKRIIVCDEVLPPVLIKRIDERLDHEEREGRK